MMKLDHRGYWYSIEGINPEPWEAPQGQAGRAKGGKLYVQMHSPARLQNYKSSVAEEFKLQNPGYTNLGETPLVVNFYLWRQVPVSETATGKKKHGKIVDVTNCQKALEDSLQGILYTNDVNNYKVTTHIVEQSEETEPFILINIDFGGVDTQELLVMKADLSEVESDGRGGTIEILSEDRGLAF